MSTTSTAAPAAAAPATPSTSTSKAPVLTPTPTPIVTPSQAAALAASSTSSASDGKIAKQLDFYFSDSNLPKDKHLQTLMKANDGWVPIDNICSFGRMKAMNATKDLVVNAVTNKKCENVECNGDRTKVRRSTPLPDEKKLNEDVILRSIYAKGWSKDSTIEAISEYFTTRGFGVRSVRLRRDAAKNFKGSAFIEFNTADVLTSVLAKVAELKLPDGTVLIVQSKGDFIRMKKEEAKKKSGGGDEKGRKKGKKRKATDEAGEKEDAKGTAPDGKGSSSGDKEKESSSKEKGEKKGGDAAEVKEKKVLVPDLLVSFSKLPADTMREDLKECLVAVGAKVRYVDYSKSQPSAVVRLNEDTTIKASQATKTLIEKGLVIKDIKPEIRALSGEEESKYWDALWVKQASSTRGGKRGGGDGGGRGRGGRGGRGRGRGGRGRGGGRGKRGGGGSGKRVKLDEDADGDS